MHIRSLRWCVTGDFKGDSRIDSLICERRRDGAKGGKGYGQDMSVKNREEAEEGKNFITLPLQREKVSKRKSVVRMQGKISAFVDIFRVHHKTVQQVLSGVNSSYYKL